MIYCSIDGKRAFPSLASELKIVIENPAMRDKSSYTYDISFPLNIAANAQCFTHLDNISVSVKKREYADCRLICDNRILFSGKGIVTGATKSEVKLQIIEEVYSSIPALFKDVYIDKVSYPAVNSRFKQMEFEDGKTNFEGGDNKILSFTDARPELESTRFLGEEGKYTFVTTLPGDASSDSVEDLVNVVCSIFDEDKWPMYHLAVQPNLLYVLKHLLESQGFTCDLSELAVEPWISMYVCSSVITLNIAEALPHWTAKKFIEEIEKLFNISFKWDGTKVVAKRHWKEDETNFISISPEEEFERNYDEDGQEYEETSNLTYNLSDIHDPMETVKREVIEKYGIKKFTTYADMTAAVANMTDKEKKTSFFATDREPYLYYWHEKTEEDDSNELREIGLFRPLYRDLTADNEKTLNIVPVAIEEDSIPLHPILLYLSWQSSYRKATDCSLAIPHPVIMPYDKTGDLISVQDVIEDDSPMEDSEAETPIEIMFVGKLNTASREISGVYINYPQTYIYNGTAIINLGLTHKFAYNLVRTASLALNSCTGITCIGGLHVSQQGIDSSSGYNKNEEFIVKFISEKVPSINCIFLIRNKKYLAKNLEVQLNENGFSKEITGHFYELK